MFERLKRPSRHPILEELGTLHHDNSAGETLSNSEMPSLPGNLLAYFQKPTGPPRNHPLIGFRGRQNMGID